MSSLLDFFVGGPARVKGLLIGAISLAAVVLAMTSWALLERSWRYGAQREAEQVRTALTASLAQSKVLSEAATACSAGVKAAQIASEAAKRNGAAMLAEARRLGASGAAVAAQLDRTLARIGSSEAPRRADGSAKDCGDAWREIESAEQKSGRQR